MPRNHTHELHPSHDIFTSDDGFDPHSPVYKCRVCNEITCSMCKLDADDDLVLPCTGFSWLEATTVTRDDGRKFKALMSGIGWF